jgi:hypothetical protein
VCVYIYIYICMRENVCTCCAGMPAAFCFHVCVCEGENVHVVQVCLRRSAFMCVCVRVRMYTLCRYACGVLLPCVCVCVCVCEGENVHVVQVCLRRSASMCVCVCVCV